MMEQRVKKIMNITFMNLLNKNNNNNNYKGKGKAEKEKNKKLVLLIITIKSVNMKFLLKPICLVLFVECQDMINYEIKKRD